MSLITVSSSSQKRRRCTVCSRSQLTSFSSSICIVDFYTHNDSSPDYFSQFTHISPYPHIKLHQLLPQKFKSGFDNLDGALSVLRELHH